MKPKFLNQPISRGEVYLIVAVAFGMENLPTVAGWVAVTVAKWSTLF